jgi:hypothetical protein
LFHLLYRKPECSFWPTAQALEPTPSEIKNQNFSNHVLVVFVVADVIFVVVDVDVVIMVVIALVLLISCFCKL